MAKLEKDSIFIPSKKKPLNMNTSKKEPTKKTTKEVVIDEPKESIESPDDEEVTSKKLFSDYITEADIIKLPVPFNYKGELIEEVYIQEITGAVEEEYKTPQNRKNIGLYITAVLGACITKAGKNNKQEIPKKQWLNIMREMPMSNRDFLMFAIYNLCESSVVTLADTKCPNTACGQVGFVADLKEHSVEFYNKEFKSTTIKLNKGLTVEGRVYNKAIVSMPNGYTQEMIMPLYAVSEAKGTSTLIAQCVDKLKDKNGVELIFNSTFSRNLTKKDRDLILEEISNNDVGILPVANISCSCGEEFRAVIGVMDFLLS